jgi:hypothetical protein
MDPPPIFRTAIKVALGFGAIGYLGATALYLLPIRWYPHPSASFLFAICPPAILTMTVDPSFGSLALILAPLNAILYAIAGFVIGGAFGEAIRHFGRGRDKKEGS